MPRPKRERTRLPGSILDQATHRNYNPDTPRIGGQFVSRKKHEEYQKSGIAPEQKHNPLRGPDGQYLNAKTWEGVQKARLQHGLPLLEPPVLGFETPQGYFWANGQLIKGTPTGVLRIDLGEQPKPARGVKLNPWTGRPDE